MKTKQIKEKLTEVVDVLSVRDGVYTAKKSYFWGFGKCGSVLADKVKQCLPEALIIDYGNHWHAFVGGAKPGSSRDSYLYCKFKLDLSSPTL